MQTSVDELRLGALGAHNSGLAISSAVQLHPSPTYNPSGAEKIVVQALAQNVRFTLDGTNPTASLGFQLKANDPPLTIPLKGCTLKVIEETATASLQFQMSG